ncbi:MAG: glycoside hydrolase family 32 protein [Prevotella sp.]|nr:glycoside hydrolase family 32 protein [Prevotella sp.]MBQ2131618.1 glycoside hydrolase family 32 protein [Prevotella sp.]
MVAVMSTVTILGCGSDDVKQDYNPLIDDPKTEEPTEKPTENSGRTEQYRPQIHFTPNRNWMNDPNGMVYANGVYHLFYQYNPQGNSWGNMSWGHATSSDLMHWEEQPVALTRDELGDIFSGSAVIDKDNTAGFGNNAMIALYTSASGAQQQSMAYSTDGGKSFTRYTGNPVIKNNDDNLRDPKVFWHEESKKWIMALAKGWKMGTEFYGSTDLKNWTHLSTFFVALPGRPSLQWECPDLISFDYKGKKKYVLLVSVNPGGPILGSGTMYFVGDFDGTTFTADPLDYPLWFDYGMDNYAGVTWSNTPNRHILIGWMNNWQYAGDVPCSPWRSAMTLPRELKLIEYDGKPLLANVVVDEVDKIASNWQDVPGTINAKDAYQLRLTIDLDKGSTITLSNDNKESFTMDIIASERMLVAHRTSATGQTTFNAIFSIPSMRAPLNTVGNSVVLDIFVDQSSVEIFTQNGSMSMTNLVFPKNIYNHLNVSGANYQAQIRSLNSVWF